MNLLKVGLPMLLLAGIVACADPPPVTTGFRTMQAGESAPSFSGPDIDGVVHAIGSEQPVTLLNMWATWCGPCIEEFPDLQQIHDDMASNGFRVLGVSVDDVDPEAIRAFGKNLGVTFPLMVDPSGTLQDRYRSAAVPSTFLIDKEGKIVRTWTGRLPTGAHEEISTYLRTIQ